MTRRPVTVIYQEELVCHGILRRSLFRAGLIPLSFFVTQKKNLIALPLLIADCAFISGGIGLPATTLPSHHQITSHHHRHCHRALFESSRTHVTCQTRPATLCRRWRLHPLDLVTMAKTCQRLHTTMQKLTVTALTQCFCRHHQPETPRWPWVRTTPFSSSVRMDVLWWLFHTTCVCFQ